MRGVSANGVSGNGVSVNVVTLLGRLSRPPEERMLPSGDRLVQLDLTITRPGERAESVPVVCFGAPAGVVGLDVDDEVFVLGRVRRRFFRAGGATQSRTEVVADQVIPSRQVKRVAAARERAHRLLDPVDAA